MSCDPAKPKSTCSMLGSSGVPPIQTRKLRRQSKPHPAALTVKKIKFFKRSSYNFVEIAVVKEDGSSTTSKIRLGDDIGEAFKNPALAYLALRSMTMNTVHARIELGLSADFVEPTSNNESVIIQLDQPFDLEKLKQERKKLIHREFLNCILKDGAQKIPQELLIDYPDLVKPFFATKHGRSLDEKSATILRLKAGFSVEMETMMRYPELIETYGL